MAGRPIDQNPGGITPRERIWAAIRDLKTFTAGDLWGEMPIGAGISKDLIRDYLKGLENAGYLQRCGRDGRQVRYRLAKDVGVEAPRVRKDGTPVTQGRGREALWRTLKILGEFDARELAAAASTEQTPVSLAEAKEYCAYLHKAGYLILARAGGPGLPARYRFNPRRNTGPKPPAIQRVKRLYDPNLGKVVWQKEDDHGLD